jgi:hypothetical protein
VCEAQEATRTRSKPDSKLCAVSTPHRLDRTPRYYQHPGVPGCLRPAKKVDCVHPSPKLRSLLTPNIRGVRSLKTRRRPSAVSHQPSASARAAPKMELKPSRFEPVARAPTQRIQALSVERARRTRGFCTARMGPPLPVRNSTSVALTTCVRNARQGRSKTHWMPMKNRFRTRDGKTAARNDCPSADVEWSYLIRSIQRFSPVDTGIQAKPAGFCGVSSLGCTLPARARLAGRWGDV